MLDELLEYKEYTDKKILDDLLKHNAKERLSKNRKQNRLKYINLNNKLSGIKRAMRIIAKYFLNKYNQDTDVAINALKAWTGDDYNNLGKKEIDDIAGYMPALFDYYYKNEANITNNKDKLDSIKILEKSFKSKLKSFNEDIINHESRASKSGLSDFNKITFNSIVYNMKNKPLERKVLVCKGDILKNVLKNNKPITSNEKDYLLKLISAYLLNVKKNQEYVSIVKTDVYNWSLCNHKLHNVYNYKFADGTYPIEMIGENRKSKLKLCDSLKENYRIVNVDNLDSIQYEETIIIDNGISSILDEYTIDSSIDLDNVKNNLLA